MATIQIQKVLRELTEQVKKVQLRAMQKYFEAGRYQDMVEGQRAIGANRMLEELGRRLRSEAGARPEWVERLDPVGELELRPTQWESRGKAA